MSESVDQIQEEQIEEVVNHEEILQNLQKEVEALKAHSQKLLNEKKTEQAKRKEAEELAKMEAAEKAKKAGDYEQLFKSSEEERTRLQQQLEKFNENITREKINNKAKELANTISSGYRANDLAEKIAQRLEISEDGFRVKSEDGSLTISKPEELLASMKVDERFSHLIDGPKATGGGANGSNSGAEKNKLTRAEYDSLSQAQQHDFIVTKRGTVTD